MATRAAYLKRADQPAGPVGGAPWTSGPDSFQLRPLPSEDVYFFIKRIDNGRIVREADPEARRRAWQAGLKGIAVAALLIMLLMPRALEMMAGYRVHQLSAEHDRLLAQRAEVTLEEARLQSPARLQQIAAQLRLANPEPRHVVVLNSARPDGVLAKNVAR
jgi:cell division protein FtsL